MKEFTEELRYEYPLTENSVVWDVGAYHGQFACRLIERYGCMVMAFEPVFNSYLSYDQLIWIRAALGAKCGLVKFGVSNDWTGKFLKDHGQVEVPVLAIRDLTQNSDPIDLLKLNCEGMEYEILECLHRPWEINKFKNIQVQFHQCAPNFEARYDAIAGRLEQTHKLTWRTPFVWENWTRR